MAKKAAPETAPRKTSSSKRSSKKTDSKKTSRRKRRGIKLEPTALSAAELALGSVPDELEPLAGQVASDGGAVLGCYREPLGAHPLMLVALPIDKVQPTPFQRKVSDAHLRKLTRAMDRTRRFLDPIIVVSTADGYQTPNGSHRLTVLKELGAQAVIGLLVPDARVAYQILALNIEKAHNLRERALEVQRMYDELARLGELNESDCQLEFEEPSLVTLGFSYAERPRLSGGAYHPALRKVDDWLDEPLTAARSARERRAQALLVLDDAVSDAVARLKERGLSSPYLKAFVVARINPLRFMKGEPPSFDDLLAKMTKRAKGLNADKIRSEDLARSGGAPED